MKKRKKWTKLKGEKGGLTARCGRGRAVVERRRGVVGRRGGRGVVGRRGARGRAARRSRAAHMEGCSSRVNKNDKVIFFFFFF